MEAGSGCSGPSEAGGDTSECPAPRPLSPTKLLPFLSNPHRNPSDVDLEALRRRLHHAPRPLKKRSSITEPEGPAGPNIQKLLYQKATLAAMETVPVETLGHPRLVEDENFRDLQPFDENQDDNVTPPPLPPRCPAPCRSLLPPLEGDEEAAGRTSPVRPEHQTEEFPPYPPPPYPSCGESEQEADVIRLPPPEVAGQVSPSAEDRVLLVRRRRRVGDAAVLGSVPQGRKSILRRSGSEPPDRSTRVKFNPLALLLDASLEGEYDLVQRVIYDVSPPQWAGPRGPSSAPPTIIPGWFCRQ